MHSLIACFKTLIATSCSEKKKAMNIVTIDKSMDQDNFDPFNFAYIWQNETRQGPDNLKILLKFRFSYNSH